MYEPMSKLYTEFVKASYAAKAAKAAGAGAVVEREVNMEVANEVRSLLAESTDGIANKAPLKEALEKALKVNGVEKKIIVQKY